MLESDKTPYATVGACGRTGNVCGIIMFEQRDINITYYTFSCGCCTVDVHKRNHLNDIVYYIVIDGVEHTILTYTHSVDVVNHVPVATLKITYHIEVFGVPMLMETTLYDVKEASRRADVNQWRAPRVTVSITNDDFNILCLNIPEIDDNDPNTQPQIIIANVAYGLIDTTLDLPLCDVTINVTGVPVTKDLDSVTTTVTTTLFPINE